MKVRTLLNKMVLKEYQTIRVLDENVEYFIESTDMREVVEECGRSKVLDFEYSKFGDCFIIYISKKKEW